MQIRTKIFAAIFFAGAVLLLTASLIFYHTTQTSLENRIYQQFLSIASLQKNRLEGILERNKERLRLVSSRTQLRLSMAQYLNSSASVHQHKMSNILQDARHSIPSFRTISVFDIQGRMVVSTATSHTEIPQYYPPDLFEQSLTANTADSLVRDAEGQLLLLLGGPLVLDGDVLGTLVIECATDHLISSINNYSGLGDTGEIIVFQRESAETSRVLLPTRFAADAALALTLGEDFLVDDFLKSPGGRLRSSLDYRGRMVMVFASALKTVDWFMAVKIDQDEAYAQLQMARRVIVTVTLILLGGAVVLAYFLAAKMTRPITALSDLAERMSRGDYRLVADDSSADEIGVLGHSFNQMASSMLNHQALLEDKVIQLEQEIAERIRAEEEVATLKGILPLCSFCNKIRDDQGDWQQVDVYLRDHSQADISHSLCPVCMEKYYPEQYAAYLARQQKDTEE